MRVVFDTCVWVSAIRSRQGASFALLTALSKGEFNPGISVALFLEYQAKLLEASTNNATSLTRKQISTVLSALAHYSDEVPIYYRLRPNLKDENDNHVFECAANFGANVIVTHNIRDFTNPELKGYSIRAMTPGEFMISI